MAEAFVFCEVESEREVASDEVKQVGWRQVRQNPVDYGKEVRLHS